MKDLSQIKEITKRYIVETSFTSENKINNDTLIFTHGIMDSMGFISIIGFIEDSFSVSPNDDELIEANFESINAISNFVFRKLQS